MGINNEIDDQKNAKKRPRRIWWLGEDTAQIRLDDLYDDNWYIRE